MLTREHGIAEYDFSRQRVFPDRLTMPAHARYVDYARQMLDVYRHGKGRTRKELHRSVQTVFADEPDSPQRRIDAFCKLLDDVSLFDRDRRGEAARLRQKVFQLAAGRHPLVTSSDRLFDQAHAEEHVKQEIAEQIGRPWSIIERELFADVMDFHRLQEFHGYLSERDLLARYNVAQVQTALFSAESMTVWGTADFKTILRYAKLARLMHTITRISAGEYRMRLDGPASVLRETRRYGVAMAKFLPALIACRDWRMHAVVRRGRRGSPFSLDLASTEGLTSHLPPPSDFDSTIEEKFAKKWGTEPREGWTLSRETEILHRDQKVFIPDFVLRHEDGRMVLLEIVGFWTPEYLEAKQATLQAFADERILIAVAAASGRQLSLQTAESIVFKSVLKVKDVLAKLTSSATG